MTETRTSLMDGNHQYNMENIVDQLSDEQIDILRDVHAKNYNGTDDDMPDAFENWLSDLSDDQIINMIGHVE